MALRRMLPFRSVICLFSTAVKHVIIYSDGACEGNPGPGGWAAVLEYKKRRRELRGHALATTNNRMEMQAAIEGLRALKEPCAVDFYTDSKYLRGGITSWVSIWKRTGWKTRERELVKNVDLWKELDALASLHCITWHWVRGHSGNKNNERCDALAVQEIKIVHQRYKPQELAQALADFRRGIMPKAPPNVADARGMPGGPPTPAAAAVRPASPLEFRLE